MKVATSMGVMSSPSSTSHARKLAAREGGEREKEAWASSMRDLATPSRRSCRPEGLAKGAPPVRPLVHGRLLRPRGDAAAARGVPCHAPLTPTPSSSHFYSPIASEDSYPRPVHDEPPLKARRSEPRPNPYNDSRPPIPAAHSNLSNVHPAQPTAHFPPTAHPTAHAAHQMPYAPKESVGVGVGGLSPRKALIQDVVLKESTRAFRSHPLFPLPEGPLRRSTTTSIGCLQYRPLLSYLPTSTEDLVSRTWNPDVAQSYCGHQTSSLTVLPSTPCSWMPSRTPILVC
ncbi:hypothetical protein C7M84_011030 [Penaeus vannamei]|uniref:Uncharacterized protein n=1 Tax=Penaeus vannamei TaxID=6689 RepID=A0A423T2P9_PENVA|nr:hypothetical protein C7M84_011030 [Penaeus vannamei]